jgi:hypothetical protein
MSMNQPALTHRLTCISGEHVSNISQAIGWNVIVVIFLSSLRGFRQYAIRQATVSNMSQFKIHNCLHMLLCICALNEKSVKRISEAYISQLMKVRRKYSKRMSFYCRKGNYPMKITDFKLYYSFYVTFLVHYCIAIWTIRHNSLKADVKKWRKILHSF